MARPYSLKVKVTGDADDAKRAMKDLSGAAGRMSNNVKKAFKTVAVVGAAALAVGLGAAVREGVSELKDMSKVNAQTTAVVQRFGKQSLITTDLIRKQAGALQELSGFDDQAIQSGQNLIGTLSNLNTTTADGASAFQRANRLMVDMAAGMGTEPVAAAKLLGKALSDPTKNLTRVAKASGLAKWETNRLVKEMKATKNPTERQALLMSALEKRFKGAAKAAGSTLSARLTVLRDKFAGLAAKLISHAIPAVEKGVKVAARMLKAIDAWADSRDGQQTIQLVGDTVKRMGAAIADATRWVIRHRDTLLALGAAVATLYAGLKLLMIIKGVVALYKALVAGQILLNIAMTANPIGIVIVAIAALAAGIAVLVKRNENARKLFNRAWTSVRPAIIGTWNVLKKVGAFVGQVLVAYVRGMWKVWSTVFRAAYSIVAPVVRIVGAIAKIALVAWLGHLRKTWGPVFSAMKSAAGPVKDIVTAIARALGEKLRGDLNWLRENGAKVWERFRDAARTVGDIVRAIASALDKAADKLESISRRAGGLKIPGFASGTRFAPGGVAWVGERGPELAFLPRGTQVATAAESRRIAQRGQVAPAASSVRHGGDVVHITVNAQGGVANDPHLLASRIAWIARTSGLAGRMA